jgi:hypothetical protein
VSGIVLTTNQVAGEFRLQNAVKPQAERGRIFERGTSAEEKCGYAGE